MKGSVTKLIITFGSRWGRIRPSGEFRDVFFNPACLEDSADFDRMTVGQEVLFIEETDRANGTRAVHVITRRRQSEVTPGRRATHRKAGARPFRVARS